MHILRFYFVWRKCHHIVDHFDIYRMTGITVPMEQLFMEYNTHHNVLFGQESNNYVFRPMGAAHAVGDMVTLDILTGPYVNETVQSFYK